MSVALIGGLLIYLGVGRALLLIFGGTIVATVLRTLGDLIASLTPLRRGSGWALAAAIVLATGILTGVVWLAVPLLANQLDQLIDRLPQSIEHLRQSLRGTAWGRAVLAQAGDVEAATFSNLLRRMTIAARTTAGVATGLVVVTISGIDFAAEPERYVHGVLLLTRPHRQPRIRAVLGAAGITLKWWVVGQLITMAVIGTVTGVGLWLIGVPLALLLGTLTALLNFIPTFGPLVAFLPAGLLALTQTPSALAYVALLWLLAQGLEGYVLTPLIQRRAVWMPPVVTLAAQVVAGVLFGTPGIIFAAPLAAVTLVLIKMLYVEDVRGNRAAVPGEAR